MYTNDKDWVIVRDYKEFVKFIEQEEFPELVSFDHDLCDQHYDPAMYKGIEVYNEISKRFTEKTGYDCAKFLVDYCLNTNKKLPITICHSMNPAGKENIETLLSNFRKFQIK